MKVFKFGGASVKDAEGIKNVARIIQSFTGEFLTIVISAMGKTTNALEAIAAAGYAGESYEQKLNELISYHKQVIQNLGIHTNLDFFIDNLIQNLEQNRQQSFPQYYDQVVSIGELISSTIVSSWLDSNEIKNEWIDARTIIATDNAWREGTVDMDATCDNVQQKLLPKLKTSHVITQGFIGKSPDGFSTTLGREGSDYTGALLAHCLGAEGLWIWKDVPGVLNADPRLFPDALKIPELTYYEAIEMTYNGAQVIHPKTIYPLREKQIPLYVKSFIDPLFPGTVICTDDKSIQYPPIIVMKTNQVLMSIKPGDLSFVAEEHLSRIYSIFARHHIRIHLIQIAALTVSVAVDNNPYKVPAALEELKSIYSVLENEKVTLLTIRHFNEDLLQVLVRNKKVLLEQRTRSTVQVLLED